MFLVKYDMINYKYQVIKPDPKRMKQLGNAIIYKGEQFSPRQQVKNVKAAYRLFGLENKNVEFIGCKGLVKNE